MYKLDPSEFKMEDDVEKLIGFLESSPLNRQALPNTGQKIGYYYRRLAKRPGESVPAFLVREDKVHDEMLKALQRRLREKELDFDGCNMTLAELKRFVGMEPEASLFYGEHEASELGGADDEEAEEEGKVPRRLHLPEMAFRFPRDHRVPDPQIRRHRKDVLELLMQKGLFPLAALDVVRGWMLLEMATSGEEERHLIRAATRNTLGYFDMKSALLSMHEERRQRTQFQGHRGGGKTGVFAAELEPGWEDFEIQPHRLRMARPTSTARWTMQNGVMDGQPGVTRPGAMRVGRNGLNRHAVHMMVANRLNTKRWSIIFIKNKKRLRESSMSISAPCSGTAEAIFLLLGCSMQQPFRLQLILYPTSMRPRTGTIGSTC